MKASFYAQFSKKNATTARLVSTSTGPPRTLQGEVVVKVQLDLPDAAFEPLTAEGVIQAGFVGIPIVVESEDIDHLIDEEDDDADAV